VACSPQGDRQRQRKRNHKHTAFPVTAIQMLSVDLVDTGTPLASIVDVLQPQLQTILALVCPTLVRVDLYVAMYKFFITYMLLKCSRSPVTYSIALT
jgi:hypothetical protein